MTVKAHRYFHINNGGVTFSVEDKGKGVELVVEQGHMGIANSSVRIRVPRSSLAEMARMFTEADGMEFSAGDWTSEKPYDHSWPRKETRVEGPGFAAVSYEAVRPGSDEDKK